MQLTDSALLRTQAYIDGAWRDAADGARFDVNNPADGRVVASVPDMGRTETRQAIEAAAAALPAWRARTAKERAAVLRKWCELMLAHQEDLALLMSSSRASRCPKRAAKWPMAPPSSNGSPRKASASTAT